MERKNFLTLLGLGAGSVIVSSCLGACGKSDTGSPAPNPNPNPGTKLDFNFDVSTNSDINTKGWTILNGAIIAKSGANYIALESLCTHQSNPMTFDTGGNIFPCSLQNAAHGSAFDINGVRLRGPATRNLVKYNTTLTGNSLRVFET